MAESLRALPTPVHDAECDSRYGDHNCNCSARTQTTRMMRAHLEGEFFAGMYLTFAHGGISFALHPLGTHKPLFVGWAANRDELEEQVCDALEGLGSFFEQIEGLDANQ